MEHSTGRNYIFAVLFSLIIVGIFGWFLGSAQNDNLQNTQAQIGIGGAPPTGIESRSKSVLADWPEAQRVVAQHFIETYGEPDEILPNRLTWNSIGPWNQTILHKDAVPDDFPIVHNDFIQQSVNYTVPLEKMDEIIEFDSNLYVDREAGTLSTINDNERMNLLTLNLVDEIVNDEKTVEEAKRFFEEEVKRLSNGDFSNYTTGLRFNL